MYRSSPNPDLGLPSSTSRSQSYDEGGAGGSKATLLDELDKLAPLKTFDVSWLSLLSVGLYETRLI